MGLATQKGAPAFLAFPDPILAANLYCSKRLTEAVSEVIVPVRRQLTLMDHDEFSYLWFMRYGRRGEHLKIRLHGPDSLAVSWQATLESAASSFLKRLDGEPPDEHRKSYLHAPPIDHEDSDAGDHPDRRLLWTRYSRNAVPLGFEPLLIDDHYVGVFTQCLGRGTDVVLAHFERTLSSGRLTFKSLQSLHLELLLNGMSVSCLTEEQAASYLLYHRDSLIRAILRSAQLGKAKLTDLFGLFGRRLDAMAPQLDSIRRSTKQIWASPTRFPEFKASLDFSRWRQSIEYCLNYIGSLDSQEFSQVDPFAREIWHPILFKILHMTANQLGIDQLNEAMSCHLLLAAVSSGGLDETSFSWLPLDLPHVPEQISK